MQISRHWRLNKQRYRLEGVQYEDGSVSLQAKLKRVEVEDEEPNETTLCEEGEAEEHEKDMA